MSPKRRSRSHGILEWKFDFIDIAGGGAVENGVIDLDLLPDEIAEIRKIMTTIFISTLTVAVNDIISAHMMISMDPDNAADPATGANHEDLEVFYEHAYSLQADYAEATETGGYAIPLSNYKSEDFDPPILVGTNLGQSTEGDATAQVDFWTRIFFTRRRATATELNQILLKRR